MGDPDSGDVRGRSTAVRIAVGLGLTLVLASATAVAIPVLQGPGDPTEFAPAPPAPPAAPASSAAPVAPVESQTVLAFACLVDPRDRDYCRRFVDDMVRRVPLTDAQRADAGLVGEQVLAVLPVGGRESRCSTGQPAAVCRLVVSPPSEAEVRRALTAAGYRNALVRRARPGDPAPHGSVLVAVPAGAACVVIYLNGYSRRTVGGRLPDGSCLAA